jgi:hypothetical protein
VQYCLTNSRGRVVTTEGTCRAPRLASPLPLSLRERGARGACTSAFPVLCGLRRGGAGEFMGHYCTEVPPLPGET